MLSKSYVRMLLFGCGMILIGMMTALLFSWGSEEPGDLKDVEANIEHVQEGISSDALRALQDEIKSLNDNDQRLGNILDDIQQELNQFGQAITKANPAQQLIMPTRSRLNTTGQKENE